MSLRSLSAEIEYDLEASGYRMTKIRASLIQIFAVYKLPLSAEDLLKILQQRRLKVHRATLYRELDFLVDKQVIHTVNLDDGQLRYEYVDRDHHHHLICLKCRKVEDVEMENDVESLEAVAAKKNKFKILKHSLEFFGWCRDCQKQGI